MALTLVNENNENVYAPNNVLLFQEIKFDINQFTIKPVLLLFSLFMFLAIVANDNKKIAVVAAHRSYINVHFPFQQTYFYKLIASLTCLNQKIFEH